MMSNLDGFHKFQNILIELLETEATYVESLENLIYLRNLLISEDFLNAIEASKIFCNGNIILINSSNYSLFSYFFVIS